MKLIEVLGRFRKHKELSEEDKAALEVKRIIDPEYEETESIIYEYSKLVINIEDIIDIIFYDDLHTQIRTEGGLVYFLKMTYNDFLKIYQDMLGVSIFSFIEE